MSSVVTIPSLPKLLTTAQLAEQLGQSSWVIGWWTREKGLPAIRIGSRLFFDPASVRAWLDEHEGGAAGRRSEVTP